MELINENFTDYPVDFPESHSIIKVIGVGGGGCNVVREIYNRGLEGIDLMICNTDEQALRSNPVNEKIRLGTKVARGLGAGTDPRKGREAAVASKEDIIKSLSDSIEMVFVTACLGGGTGTGAAPVIAEIAKSMNKLVVGVVTIPFRDEGPEFMARAMDGLKELRQYVDSLLIIDNQKIYQEYGELPMKEGFKKANEVLVTAVKSISEIVTNEGEINVDMNDVRMVMGNSGMATMGIGIAEGEDRATKAVEEAFKSPLLNDCDLQTSKGALVNISASDEKFTMAELRQAVESVKSFTGQPQRFKRGLVYDPTLGDKVCVTVIATGFDVLNLPDVDGHTIIIPGRVGETVTSSAFSPINNPKEERRNFQEVEKGPVIEDIRPHRRVGSDKPVLITDDESQIIELENTPAYERKNKKRNPGINTGNASNFSITSNAEGQTIIPSNRYLHQTQD